MFNYTIERIHFTIATKYLYIQLCLIILLKEYILLLPLNIYIYNYV